MLVKQVFSRFTGVWIFAVALLVGEVLCDVHEIHIDAIDKSAKFSMYRIQLMYQEQSKDIAMESNDECLGIIETMVTTIVSTDTQLCASFKILPGLYDLYDPSTLVNQIIHFVRKSVRKPFLTNFVLNVRLHKFCSSLELVIKNIQKYWGESGQEPLKTRVSKLISHLGELPFLDKYERGAYLPKTASKVSWFEVQVLLSQMEKALRKFVPTDDKLYPDAVTDYFLPVKDGEINTSIVDAVEGLFEINRCYRLVVSEVHTVYIEDYPSALLNMGFLQETLRKLHRLVTWVENIRYRKLVPKLPDRGKSGRSIGEEDKQTLVKSLRVLDSETLGFKHLHTSVVSDLKQVLDWKLDLWLLSPLNSLPYQTRHPMTLFVRVFAEFQAMSHSFRMYELMKGELVANPRIRLNTTVEGSRMRLHLKYLVAFTDQNSEKVLEILKSSDVGRICSEGDNSLPNLSHKDFGYDVEGVQIIMQKLCQLRSEARAGLPNADNLDSFFHKFISIYPKPNFTSSAGLLPMPPCRTGERRLFEWTSFLSKGLAELNLSIGLHMMV